MPPKKQTEPQVNKPQTNPDEGQDGQTEPKEAQTNPDEGQDGQTERKEAETNLNSADVSVLLEQINVLRGEINTLKQKQTDAKEGRARSPGGNNVEVGAEVRTIRENRAEETKKKLATYPKQSFMFPLGFGEKKGATFHVQINGYTYIGKKGVQVDLPIPVIKLLYDSMRDTYMATEQFLAPEQIKSGGLRG